MAISAQDKYTLKVPDGLPFADFRGYEDWQVVAVSQTENLLKVMVANPIMIKAYRAGIPGNGQPFPDGAKIAKIEWKAKVNSESPFWVRVPDTLQDVFLIEKDSKKYPDTKGWAYAVFDYDPAAPYLCSSTRPARSPAASPATLPWQRRTTSLPATATALNRGRPMDQVQVEQRTYQMPPLEGISVAHFLTVADIARSARYYEKVFGARILSLGDGDARGYLQLANIWMILNVGGGPTPDKPTVTLSVPNPNHINSFMNFRVADIQACYELWKSRGAQFITQPIPKYGETRCLHSRS